MKKKLCDCNCNECPVILHPNSRMVTRILNMLRDRFGDEAYGIVQEHCPNLTVCYDCRIDDFCHVEGCDLADESLEVQKRFEGDPCAYLQEKEDAKKDL